MVSAHNEEMETPSEIVVAESGPVLSSMPGAASDADSTVVSPDTFVAESAVDYVSLSVSSDPKSELRPPQEIPLPAEGPMDEASFSDIEPLTFADFLYDVESDDSGSDVESLSVASTTSSLQRAADLTDLLLQADDPDRLAAPAVLLSAVAESSVVGEDGSSSLDH